MNRWLVVVLATAGGALADTSAEKIKELEAAVQSAHIAGDDAWALTSAALWRSWRGRAWLASAAA